MAGQRGGVAAAAEVPLPQAGLRPSPICPGTLDSRSGVPSPPLIGGGEGQGEVGDHPQRHRPGGGMVRRRIAIAVAPPPLTPALSAPWRGGEGARRRRRKFLSRLRLRPSPVCADRLRRRSGVPSPPLIGGGEGQGEVGDHPQRPRPGGGMVRLSMAVAVAVAPPHLTPALSAPWRGGEGAWRRRRKFLSRLRLRHSRIRPGTLDSRSGVPSPPPDRGRRGSG
jgi:hypothetical protein